MKLHNHFIHGGGLINYETLGSNDLSLEELTYLYNAVCEICDTKLGSIGETINHLGLLHGKKIPGRKMPPKLFFEPNETEWEQIQNLVCPICQKNKFIKKDTLYMHIRNVHSGLKYACEICPAKLCSKGSLNSHIHEQHIRKNGNELQCNECDFKNISRRELNTHI